MKKSNKALDTASHVPQDKKVRVQDLGRGSCSKNILQSPASGLPMGITDDSNAASDLPLGVIAAASVVSDSGGIGLLDTSLGRVSDPGRKSPSDGSGRSGFTVSQKHNLRPLGVITAASVASGSGGIGLLETSLGRVSDPGRKPPSDGSGRSGLTESKRCNLRKKLSKLSKLKTGEEGGRDRPRSFGLTPSPAVQQTKRSGQDTPPAMYSNTMGIRVGQINLHHSKVASHLLNKRLVGGEFDIVLIQEPWIRDAKIMGLSVKGYNIFYDTFCDKPRACIVSSSKLNVLNLVNFLDGDFVAVKVIYAENEVNLDFIFASAYLPFESIDPLSDQAKALIRHCSSDKRLIIGCDANAHHTLWGSSDCNKRGDELIEYILYYNLFILNRGNEPTFVIKNRREVIDLTLCNSKSLDYIHDWKVANAITASDHQLIVFSVSGLKLLSLEGRNPRFTDWGSYREELRHNLSSFPCTYNSFDDLQLAVDQLQQAILDSYHHNCKAVLTSSPRHVPWWSSELSRLRSKCRKLFNRAKKNGDWLAYKQALTIYNKAIRTAKRCSWQRFCGDVSDISATAKLAKIMTKDSSCRLNAIKLSNGTYSESGNEILAEMLSVHFPGSQPATFDCTLYNDVPHCTREMWEVAKLVVSHDKVFWAINSFKPYKSPGLDGIVPILLIKGIDILVPHLCRIFRACIVYGYIPISWRYTKVVFIPKAGKDNYLEAKSFRPISLTSFLLKTLEKLVDRYIRDCVLVDNPLALSQHAYQPGKSTSSALYELTFLLEKSIKNKETALAVFLDIEGAFDRVPINSIILALNKKGLKPVLSDWIKNLLSLRYVSASILGSSMVIHATSGCPQGGVLSPILWCITVDSLLVQLVSNGLHCVSYADDVAIIARGKFDVTLSGIMNNALKLVARWCLESGLSVNPAKTSLVAFSRKRKLLLQDIFLFNERLVWSTEVKFLGVFFDKQLIWGRHFDYCLNKAKRIFWCCRSSIGRTWGLSPKVIYWIYNMIICPVITYGCIAWWSRTRLDSVKLSLQRFQRMVCVALSGCIRTTPTMVLELLLGLLPLHLRIEAEALICFKRFKSLGYWRSYSKYLSWGLFNPQVAEHWSYLMPNDGILLKYAFHKPFKIFFPSREEWSVDPFWVNDIYLVWFTDGSKLNCRVGAGICCPLDGTKLSLPLGEFATVFQAEVYAIYICCKLCLNRGYRNLAIHICSDSQAALLSLQKYCFTSSLVGDCHKALCDLAVNNMVSLFWVPGHSGIQGNELADELARLGSSCPFIGPEPAVGISSATIRSFVFSSFRQLQYCNWLSSVGQRQAKELNRDCPSLRSGELLKLHRKGLSKVIGLLTGHCTLKRHLNIMGIVDDPFCRVCHLEEESARHILCDCEALSAHRFEHLGRHIIEPWELQDIPVRCLLNFASATGLFP